jgi:hypothetical protein
MACKQLLLLKLILTYEAFSLSNIQHYPMLGTKGGSLDLNDKDALEVPLGRNSGAYLFF